VCFGGIGWSGHVAYIEPGSEAFAPCPMEEWVKIGPRIVELTPFSILQNCLGPEFGQSGDWSIVPPRARRSALPSTSAPRYAAPGTGSGGQLDGFLAEIHDPAGGARAHHAARAVYDAPDGPERAQHRGVAGGEHRAGFGRGVQLVRVRAAAMNILLWVLQIVLAVKFLSVAYTHGLRPDPAKMQTRATSGSAPRHGPC